MDVSSAASVVAREDGLELDNTIGIARLDSTKESVVKVAGIGRVAVPAGADSRVYTLFKDGQI